MNLPETAGLREALQALMDGASRTNAAKPQKYWYPLSQATYQVEEVLAAVDSMVSFRTTMWEKTARFEREFAALNGGGEAIMVNSGSSADLLIAFALSNPRGGLLQPGDEVLVPSVTWPTQVWSLMQAGLRVRFIDTDPRTLNVNLAHLEASIGERTRGISLVHLMGNPCDMDEVERIRAAHDLVLVEDCCESLGAEFRGRPVGSFGTAAAYSFFFSHHITTMEGGMITCRDQELSDLLRLLRAHGWARNARFEAAPPAAGLDPRYTFLNWGFNVRPTELQAGFGLVQLGRMEAFLRHRIANAEHFQAILAKLPPVLDLMQVHPQALCSWFALPMLVSPDAPFTRDELVAHLEEMGVETRPVVAGSLARQPVIEVFPELGGQELPGADAVHERGFYLGLHPFDARPQLDRLGEVLEQFLMARV